MPSSIDCTITSSLTGIPASTRVTTVPVQADLFTPISYSFPVAGLPDGGVGATFYFDTRCQTTTNHPDIVIKTPSLVPL